MTISAAAQAGARIPAFVGAAILLLAFAIQVPIVLNPDLAWLLTVAERVLQGQRLGVDIYELNPPAAVVLYMAPAFLGMHLPLAPEIWVILQTLALSAGSVLLTLRILGPALAEPAVRARAGIVLLAILTVAPAGNFAEREHFACIGLLPFVALASRFAQPDAPARRLAVLAGIAAGLAMCLKPYFAAIAGLPLIWNVLVTRRPRALLGIESWTAAAVVIAYALWVITVFPAYFHSYTKVIALVYLPYRMSLPYMLTGGLSTFAALFLALLYLTRGTAREDWRGAGCWVAAALGGVLSYLAQGKAFGYVQLPMVLFALAAAAMAPFVLRPDLWQARGLPRRLAAVILASALVLVPIPGSNRSEEFLPAVREIAPPRPSVLVISDASEIGQPLTRKLGGTWASAKGSMLEAAGAMDRLASRKLTPAETALAEQIVASERLRVRDDLRLRRPDVLMIDGEYFHAPFDWLGWMRHDPATAAELDTHYRLARTVGKVGIWVRQREGRATPGKANP